MRRRSVHPATGGSLGRAPKFAADRNLVRLVRWLRLLGCDVACGPHLGARAVATLARREDRTLLTRERRVLRDPDRPRCIVLEEAGWREQLCQVVRESGIDPTAHLFERCVECNGLLETVGLETGRGRVPDFVLQTQSELRRCRGCRHFYWGATHLARIRAELDRLGLGAGKPPGVERQ